MSDDIVKEYIEIKKSEEYVDYMLDPQTLISFGYNCGNLKNLNKNTQFCCFKTKYRSKDAVVFLFSIKLYGPSTGSRKTSEESMDLVNYVSKKLGTIDYRKFETITVPDKKRENIGYYKVVKIIREDDYL